MQLIAIKGEGIDLLFSEIEKHYRILKEKKMLAKKDNQKYKNLILKIASEKLLDNFLTDNRSHLIDNEISKERKNRLSPYDLFDKIKC